MKAEIYTPQHFKKNSVLSYVLLIVGILAVIIGTILLLDIAIGLLLLFGGFTLINRYLSKR